MLLELIINAIFFTDFLISISKKGGFNSNFNHSFFIYVLLHKLYENSLTDKPYWRLDSGGPFW